MSDLEVLNFQQVIAWQQWEYMKRDPELLERVTSGQVRQRIAAEIADKHLAKTVLTEPDLDSPDPTRWTNAVLRMTVAVASKGEASALAREMEEAEDRGFEAAMQGMKAAMDRTLALSNGSREANYASVILDGLIRYARGERRHRPAADWRPMRTAPLDGALEYLFINGETAGCPRLSVPRPRALTFDAQPTCLDIVADVLEAVAWRYAGREPHSGEPT